DTAKLAFTKRLLVVDSRVSIFAQVQPPFDNDLVHTHQKIQLRVNTQQLNILTPQQTHVVIIQNNRWDNAVKDIQPSFIRGKELEYNSEQDCVFPAGKEYRWADLENFRFMSDRIEKIDPTVTPFQIYIKPDVERNDLRYVYFKDRDGWDEIATTESVNPWWQTDYAYVHFSFVPSHHQPYAGRSVYLIGESTGNTVGDSSRMEYDAATGAYRKTLYLKQGYYSYTYVTKADNQPDSKADATLTDGNYWETENTYTILFYYRGFADRTDQLVGISTINSLNGIKGY
ncbi:MAG TPA: hypothetical protein VG842_06955, partial [Sediminibacterium sp.]|nr:hypothetical protein [Sediminibacterium sp.]